MKKLNRVDYKELEQAATNNNYELIDVIDGCLVDSVLYVKHSSKPDYNDIYIAGFKTYLNEWSSALTVYIARTTNDIDKLLKKWSQYQEQTAIA